MWVILCINCLVDIFCVQIKNFFKRYRGLKIRMLFHSHFEWYCKESWGVQQLTGGKVASSGLSCSSQEKVVLMQRTIFSSLNATSLRLKETGSKLGPMIEPYLPLAQQESLACSPFKTEAIRICNLMLTHLSQRHCFMIGVREVLVLVSCRVIID